MHPNARFAALASAVAAFAASTVVYLRVTQRCHQPRRSRKNPKFRRAALLYPLRTDLQTPWNQVVSCRTNDDFLLSLNFTRTLVFETLLPFYNFERGRCNWGSPYRNGPKVRGRAPQLKSIDLLGMALWYLKSKGNMLSLSSIFGLVQSSVSVWLDYSLEVLLRVVKQKARKEFEIRWPTEAEMHASASLLESNRTLGPLLKGVLAVTDGGRMPCADYTDPNLQNAYFEGFTQGVEVTNLFVWNFFGEIIHTAVNFPGSWHDTKLASASGLYFPKLSDEMTPAGLAILGDSAFVNNTTNTNGKVIRGGKTNERCDIPESADLAAVDIILQRVMPRERQSAEWGVRALKGPFARLKTPLPADSKKRLRLLRICSHLFNFRTRYVGLNQIRTTYGTQQRQ